MIGLIVGDTRALLWRWLLHARRDIMSLSIGLMQPLIFFLFGGLFGGVFASSSGALSGFSKVDYLSFYSSGVLAFTMLTNAVLGGIPVVFDRENGFIDKILSAPISRTSIVASRFLYVTLYSLAQALLVLGFGYLIGVRFQGETPWPIALAGIVGYGTLLSAGVTALSLALAFAAAHHAVFFTITGFFLTPVLILSSAFVPLDKIPAGALRFIATWNPLTHAIDPMRSLMCGSEATGRPADYAFHALFLLAFDVVCFVLAVRVIRARLD